jgi:hypothetical protein
MKTSWMLTDEAMVMIFVKLEWVECLDSSVVDMIEGLKGCEWLKPGREMSLGGDGWNFCVDVKFRMSI